MSKCRRCQFYLVGREVGCLQYGSHGRTAELEQIKTVLAGADCDEFKPSKYVRK